MVVKPTRVLRRALARRADALYSLGDPFILSERLQIANFALQHRYAMALHTDQAHPHVHLVVKCEHEYEPGKRLYIRKDTLRRWREQFAELMREQGVSANATPRQLRGQVRRPQRDAIHHRLRAMRAFGQLGAAEVGRHTPPRPSQLRSRRT